jgi:hypothetical protein
VSLVNYGLTNDSLVQNIVPIAVGLNMTQPYVEDVFSMPSFEDCKFLLADVLVE